MVSKSQIPQCRFGSASKLEKYIKLVIETSTGQKSHSVFFSISDCLTFWRSLMSNYVQKIERIGFVEYMAITDIKNGGADKGEFLKLSSSNSVGSKRQKEESC